MGQLNNFVGGRFVPSDSGAFLDNINPATGQVISQIPRSNEADVAAAVAAAKAALAGPWGKSSATERADLLERIAAGIEARLMEFAAAESADNGKPVRLAAAVDIPRAVANFRFFAGAIRHDQTGCHTMPGVLNYTLRKPVGITALITPWNLPLYLLTWKLAPALGMGNVAIAKPSELTPTTATMLAEVFAEVGAPAGIYNLLHGYGPEVGAPMVAHPAIRAVSFTGGTATGAHVAAAAAPRFKKLSLELGGKNATVVFADCDFEATVKGTARAAFLNQGQICLCGSRILVEASIYERYVEALVAQTRSMKVGAPTDPSVGLGALISHEHRDKVEGYLKLAQQEGGTIRCGGQRLDSPGAFLTPAVITDLGTDSRCATEEIFGPVVTVHSFTTEEEAIEKANCVRYGLAASVWTQDLSRAHRVAGALETGMVWVNTWLLRDLRVPFGGVKDSGFGREGGHYSMEFFSESQNICVKL